ncbi:hypothetical protein AMTRI_Chr09g13690 [Amborella trichopoda]
MGRGKLERKMVENEPNRRVTYSKRKMAFSRRLMSYMFSVIFARYVDLPVHIRERFQNEELQQEIIRVQHELEDAERKLRIFEGEPIRIASLSEAEYYEHILQDTLSQLNDRKTYYHGENSNASGFNSAQIPDWFPPRETRSPLQIFIEFYSQHSIRYFS